MSSPFPPCRPYLILFIADNRQGPSPSASLNFGNEAGYRGDEQKFREGRAALDVTTAITDSGQAAEYGNTSATYWNLYLSEAETNDKNLVESLEADTKSTELVVSLSTPPI